MTQLSHLVVPVNQSAAPTAASVVGTPFVLPFNAQLVAVTGYAAVTAVGSATVLDVQKALNATPTNFSAVSPDVAPAFAVGANLLTAVGGNLTTNGIVGINTSFTPAVNPLGTLAGSGNVPATNTSGPLYQNTYGQTLSSGVDIYTPYTSGQSPLAKFAAGDLVRIYCTAVGSTAASGLGLILHFIKS